ncbi:phosphotransferase enzyme family protein [Nannizzia gypsea CBS 118893]|uniref:Phosphotransferase enzyme family protein n=1 Tax=Arthroderma gypseum (strain ATCC MYA-4604 / CBS 118893) TaxID=535722 RepID=E4UVK0_ARTGP|nr:phosphotransferase enzyme family protein [Nannizzia gypsea CBS 118893]EFR02327.1 phosphotransferase enzyme family protein [Nannizzia gypsea CBS 118893]
MDDGKEVIAKIPNPNAGRAHFLTFSEVATMDFVSQELFTYTSTKVYSWCSDASKSRVGAEYIIMGKTPGAQLSTFLDNMDVVQKSKIVENIVLFEKSLALNPFPAYGSLYYSDSDTTREKFTVGATNYRKYFDDGRGSLALDRGLWFSTEDYVAANAKWERESIISLGPSPRLQGVFNGPNIYQPSKAAKLHALDLYLSISKYPFPTIKIPIKVYYGTLISTPTIPSSYRAPFSTSASTGILGLRWSHSGKAQISFPENFDDLQSEEKIYAKKLRDEQALYVLYEIELLRQCRAAGSALHGRDTLVSRLMGLAGSLFTDGEPVVLGYLMQAVDRWGEIVGVDAAGEPLVPCPIDVTDTERAKQRADQQKWEGVELMDEIFQYLGAYSGRDGFVSPDDYEVKMQHVITSQEAFLQSMAGSDEGKTEQWRKDGPLLFPKF